MQKNSFEYEFINEAAKFINFSVVTQIMSPAYAKKKVLQSLYDIKFQDAEYRGMAYTTFPFIKFNHGFFYNGDIEYSPLYFLTLFHPLLWITLGFTLLLIFLCFFLLHRFSTNSTKIFDSFWYAINISDEKLTQIPKISSKIIIGILALLSLCITASYSGFLSAEIVIQKPRKLPFQTLDELADLNKFPDYKLCMKESGIGYSKIDIVKYKDRILHPSMQLPHCKEFRFTITKTAMASLFNDICQNKNTLFFGKLLMIESNQYKLR